MPRLSGFWHGAASLTGRIDFSQAVHQMPTGIERCDAATLGPLGITPRHARRLYASSPLDTTFAFCTLDDPSYPPDLAPLPFAPPVLFMDGDEQLLSARVRLAIVGARRCTANGLRIARDFAQGVAQAGGVIVSGLANGIDTAAHLAAPSRTIAVLGSGLNRVGTRAQQRTARTIIDAGGLVMSEFLPDIPASKHTFPQRNRIIAGLCQGTIVVEAATRSGAKITARHALEAGREVFAVPGSPLVSTSAGCLELLLQGAGLVRSIDDVWDALGIPHRPTAHSDHPIIQAMDGRVLAFHELMQCCELPPVTLMRTLSMLEMTGQIVRLPGDRYAPK